MTSNPCNKYEQMITSYLLSVLEYNIDKTSKGIECCHHCRDLYFNNTSWFSSCHFNDNNFNVMFWHELQHSQIQTRNIIG